MSLRDLAATIVDLAGLGAGSPFPGESLARFWRRPVAGAGRARRRRPRHLRSRPQRSAQSGPTGLLKPRWPLAALAEGDWTYIRREGDVREELFHLRDDATGDAQPRRRPGRASPGSSGCGASSRLTAGPLTLATVPSVTI